MPEKPSSVAETPPSTDTLPKPKPPKLGLTVWGLGFVSLLTDMSSEMVYPLNALLLTTVLNASPILLGLIEGIAESMASLLRLYSGQLSDRIGQRKPLAVAGYALAMVAKPLIGISTNWGQVLAARLLDRSGKGLRSAPRDALLTESVPPEIRGRAFGLHRSMDTWGALLGPLIGFGILTLVLKFSPPVEQIRTLYQWAFWPGLASVLVLFFFVREKKREKTAETKPTVKVESLAAVWRGITPEYRDYLRIVVLFGIGNSSDAFLLLQAQQQGFDAPKLLLLYALFNITEALLAYQAGRLSDRFGRRPLLATGYFVFALVYAGFALIKNERAVYGLFILYGLYYTLTQGTQRALAADLAKPSKRGAEIGLYHFTVGILALPSSLLAGWLYQNIGSPAPFILGAGTALIAGLMMLLPPPAPKKLDHQSVRIGFHTVSKPPS